MQTTSSSATRVLIADDHPLIRLGVRCELEDAGFEVVGEEADARAAVQAALATRPDLCVLDVRMPGDGIEAAREIKERLPGTKVVMMTSSEDDDDLANAIFAGASGYVGKHSDPARLPHVLQAVLRGEIAIPRSFVSVLVERLGAGSNGGVPGVEAARPAR